MTTNPSPPPLAERRPIKSRDRRLWQQCAARLASAGVAPNAISASSTVFAALAGAAFAATAWAPSPWVYRGLWLLGAVGAQLRLIANMLDGMVALQSGKASPVGELYNEVPDRLSDAFIFTGLGYAAGSSPWMGYVAACVALFVAYVRAMGKVAGAGQEFCGPMAKPHRMAVVTFLAIYCLLTPVAWQHQWWGPGRSWGIVQGTLLLIALGGLVTAWRRLARIAAVLGGTPS